MAQRKIRKQIFGKKRIKNFKGKLKDLLSNDNLMKNSKKGVQAKLL